MRVHACGWVTTTLAVVRSQALQLPGLPEAPPPVCAATARLARDVVRGWSPTRHWLYHAGFRCAVHTLLLMHERTWRLSAPVEDALPYLDVELWFLVCGLLRREDFECT